MSDWRFAPNPEGMHSWSQAVNPSRIKHRGKKYHQIMTAPNNKKRGPGSDCAGPLGAPFRKNLTHNIKGF